MSKIVLIEPDSVLANQYFDALSNERYEVVIKHSADNALDVLDDSVKLLILELQLGPHNGLEFLYEIRSYEDLADIPVVVLSAVSPNYVVSTGSYELLGVTEYLYKPQTSLTVLRRTVEQLLEQASGQ